MKLHSVILLVGDAALLVERALDEVVSAVLPECGLPAFNHSTFSATDSDPMGALRTARTLPMMANRRLVVLKHLHEAKADLLESAVEYAASPNDTTVLVMTAAGFARPRKGGKDWGARLKNAVKKSGRLTVFDTKKINPVRFAIEHATSVDKELSRNAADVLVSVVGADIGTLAREVEKVALYVGDANRIEPDDVAAACSAVAQQDAWALTGAIANGDVAGAVGVLQPLLEEDDSSGRIRMILGQLGWQVRQLAVVSDGMFFGQSDKQIGPSVRGFGKWDLIRAARKSHQRGTLKRADELIALLAVANRLMNSHRAGDRRILEALVIDLAGG